MSKYLLFGVWRIYMPIYFDRWCQTALGRGNQFILVCKSACFPTGSLNNGSSKLGFWALEKWKMALIFLNWFYWYVIYIWWHSFWCAVLWYLYSLVSITITQIPVCCFKIHFFLPCLTPSALWPPSACSIWVFSVFCFFFFPRFHTKVKFYGICTLFSSLFPLQATTDRISIPVVLPFPEHTTC